MGWIKALLITGLVAISSVSAVSTPASAGSSTAPCANVDFGYFPRYVTIGQTMDMDLSVENCSTMRERLFLEVRWNGPCEFYHPTPRVYELEAGHGIGMNVLFLVPECPGNYRAAVRLTMGCTVLDRARSGFIVSPPAA